MTTITPGGICNLLQTNIISKARVSHRPGLLSAAVSFDYQLFQIALVFFALSLNILCQRPFLGESNLTRPPLIYSCSHHHSQIIAALKMAGPAPACSFKMASSLETGQGGRRGYIRRPSPARPQHKPRSKLHHCRGHSWHPRRSPDIYQADNKSKHHLPQFQVMTLSNRFEACQRKATRPSRLTALSRYMRLLWAFIVCLSSLAAMIWWATENVDLKGAAGIGKDFLEYGRLFMGLLPLPSG